MQFLPFASFALLTLCVMAAILTSSCNKDQNSRREAIQPAASPRPSPNPSVKPKPEGETIIVIKGGGSVDVDFDKTYYVSNGATNPLMCVRNATIMEFEAGAANSPGPFTPCTISNQNSAITIDAGGGKKNIKIKRNSAHGLQIEFYKSEYQDTTGTKHHSPNAHLKKITVNPPLPNCQCPTTGECAIIDSYNTSVRRIESTGDDKRNLSVFFGSSGCTIVLAPSPC